MCILFVAVGQHPDFPVVLAHNRDEWLARRCERMEPRDWRLESGSRELRVVSDGEGQTLLAGRDLQAGGTWLGLSRVPRTGACRFATVLNNSDYREPSRPGAPSRGMLPARFLLGPPGQSPGAFIQALAGEAEAEEMAGFALLCAAFGRGTEPEVAFVRNRARPGEEAVVPALGPGIHVLCNDATLASDWGRVRRGRQLFTEALQAAGAGAGATERLEAELFGRLLLDRAPPVQGDTDRKGDVPLFIEPLREAYGTRAATVVLCSHDGDVRASERCFEGAAPVPGVGDAEHVFLSRGGGPAAGSWMPLADPVAAGPRPRL